MFNKVLVATDLLEACDAAVLTTLEIAQQNNGEFYILHVLESDSTIYRQFVKHFKTGEEIVSDEAYEEMVRKEIEKKCAVALKAYGKYEIKVTAGFPWEEILKWARRKRADLIVLGPHSKRAEEKGVKRTSGTIGSTIEGVVMRERCPVMIVNRVVSKDRLNFKRLMVSTDFSKSCAHALRFASKFAQKHGSKLFIFHMSPSPSSQKYYQADYETDLHFLEKKLEALCGDIPNGIECEYGVCGGALPHLEIEKYADQNDVDLIVMGSHTKEKDGKWYVGSAVEQVSLRSICPVIVVTDPKVLLSMHESF
jgi:nucleotide-binding universal stress UspA family protein